MAGIFVLVPLNAAAQNLKKRDKIRKKKKRKSQHFCNQLFLPILSLGYKIPVAKVKFSSIIPCVDFTACSRMSSTKNLLCDKFQYSSPLSPSIKPA